MDSDVRRAFMPHIGLHYQPGTPAQPFIMAATATARGAQFPVSTFHAAGHKPLS
jgi:hypothetical protein